MTLGRTFKILLVLSFAVPLSALAEGLQLRSKQVSTICGAADRGEITYEAAVVLLTDAEAAAWADRQASARSGIEGAQTRLSRDREAIAHAAAIASPDEITGASTRTYAQTARILAGKAGTPVGLQQALALVSRGAHRALPGKLTVEAASALLMLALGEHTRAPGLGWAADLDDNARSWLRDQLTGGRYLSDHSLGLALAVAVGLGGAFNKPLVRGVVQAPGLDNSRRDTVIGGLMRGLAALDYSTPERTELYKKTVRPLLIEYLDDGTLEAVRAAASFGVWRVGVIGEVDALAKEVIAQSLSRNSARPITQGEAHALWRTNPKAAAPLLSHLGLKPYRFQADGPWDISERALMVAEAHCGPLGRPAVPEDAAPPAQGEDEKTRQRRRIVRATTAEIVALVDNHPGALNQSLSYRRCEAWGRLMEAERFGSKEYRAAEAAARTCLEGHVAAFEGHDTARLELARLLDDAGRDEAVAAHLVKLVDAKDERARILGSYRLLGLLSPEKGAGGRWAGVSTAVARRAAGLVSQRGFDPHQRTFGALILAWLEATGGQPDKAYSRLVGLLKAVKNADDGTFAFAHVGGLLDYLNSVSVLAGVPAPDMVSLYAAYGTPVRRSALLQLAHLYSRHGRAKDVERIARALGEDSLDPASALVLVDARLREYGPESDDPADGGARQFDARSAQLALAQLDRLERIRKGADALLADAATCVMLGNAEAVAVVLIDTKQHRPAGQVLNRALAVAKASRRAALMVRLAEVQERLGRDADAVELYREALKRQPTLATARPLVVLDFYQAAYRLGDAHAAEQAAAAALVDEHAPAMVRAALSEYPKGSEQNAVLGSITAALAQEKKWARLESVAVTLRREGLADIASAACFAGQQGQLWQHVAAAGLAEHFGEGVTQPLDGPARCQDAARSPERRSGLAPAIKAAQAALHCAPGADERVAMTLVYAELSRLNGDLKQAASALTRTRKAGVRKAEWIDVNQRVAWSALVGGDLKMAATHMEWVPNLRARFWAAHIRYSERDFEGAARLFEALRDEAPDDLEPAIWAARARLELGDAKAWSRGLEKLAKARGKSRKARIVAVVSEVQRNGHRAPVKARRLLKKLARRSSTAKGLLALEKAQKTLTSKVKKLAETRTRSRKRAARNARTLARRLPVLLKQLRPALKAGKGQVPSAAVIVPALDVVVGGLDYAHAYLSAHEDLLGRSRKSAEEVTQNLAQLEEMAIGLGQTALAAAQKQGYSGPALRRLSERLARRFPETFGQGAALAVACDDELQASEHIGDVTLSGVPAALARLASRGHGELATVLTQACAPKGAADTVDWAALRFAVAWSDTARAHASVKSRVAADLARLIAGGATVAKPLRAMLAAHFAGVDCQRALALSKDLGTSAHTLARVQAGCSGDLKQLRVVLEKEAQVGHPRALRRLADLLQMTAETPADAEAITQTIGRAAKASGLSGADVMSAPVCSLRMR